MRLPDTLVEAACDEIKRMIATGELKAGDRLLEVQLAERLGISRPPLREALSTLAARHILTLTPRRGYRVAPLSREDADEIYSLRNALERFALDEMEASLAQADFGDIDKTMVEMWSAAHADDHVGVFRANREFHIALVDLAQHRRLSQMYRTLMEQMHLYMSFNLSSEAASSGSLIDGCRRHDSLLDALKSGDRDRINQAFIRHGERKFMEIEDPWTTG
ncbi:MAG: GntR family transcriptional regulator [Mycobacterium sp.]